MSTAIVGSFSGLVEGAEAGLGVESLQADEQNPKKKWIQRIIGASALALGVYAGHKTGGEIEEVIEHSIGEAGTGFLPAVAVGSMMWWHAVREKRPDQRLGRVMKSAPMTLLAAFSAWEGAEAGILGASANAKLGAVAIMAGTGYVAGSGVVELMKRGVKKVNPKNFMNNIRLAALVPAGLIGAVAAPELVESPTLGASVAAGAGVIAIAGALRANLRHEQPSPAEQQN
jgi:hypothetical protein